MFLKPALSVGLICSVLTPLAGRSAAPARLTSPAATSGLAGARHVGGRQDCHRVASWRVQENQLLLLFMGPKTPPNQDPAAWVKKPPTIRVVSSFGLALFSKQRRPCRPS